jgi:hypothetical protein
MTKKENKQEQRIYNLSFTTDRKIAYQRIFFSILLLFTMNKKEKKRVNNRKYVNYKIDLYAKF